MELDKEFWNRQYIQNKTGWDMGYPSPPLVEYIDQLENKEMRILVPGAGNAWEVEYLWQQGFKNTFLLDFSEEAILRFKKRVPSFPKENILEEDFFEHYGIYDLILEQTFFTSFSPEKRIKLIQKTESLLKENGKYVGLVFNHEFAFQGPPFGATPNDFINILIPYLDILLFEQAYNSIKPRKGREHFLIAKRKIKN